MSIFLVETYLAKHERQNQFQKLLKEFLKFKKENPKVFEGLKSWKLLQQQYGGTANMYVEMWEFENLKEMEETQAKLHENKEMKRIITEFNELIDQATSANFIWESIA